MSSCLLASCILRITLTHHHLSILLRLRAQVLPYQIKSILRTCQKISALHLYFEIILPDSEKGGLYFLYVLLMSVYINYF